MMMTRSRTYEIRKQLRARTTTRGVIKMINRYNNYITYRIRRT